MTVEDHLKHSMIDNSISDKTELAKKSGIDIQRLNRRLKAPSTITLGELAALDDVLGFDDETILDIVKEVIWGREKLMKRNRR